VYYLVDRAHNVVLEQLMRGGLVGLLLWLLLVPTIVVVGALRVRQSGSDAEAVLRLGGIAALVAHVAELQAGFATATSLALFWIIAAWVTLPRWLVRPELAADPIARPRWRPAAIALAVLLLIVTTGATTRWLFASIAYRQGAALGIADRPREAGPAFERSRTLMPWLPLPAEAFVQTRLQLGGAERDGARRALLFAQGEAALVDLRRHALPGATDWTLAAQLAFAQVRLGDRGKLEAALEGFERALALSPRNADIIAQRAWALLVKGDPEGARRGAEQALAISPERNQWMAWGVIALAARQLGDRAAEEEALRMAVQFPPPAGRGPTP
jgi:tetratricopeptide (TPR) repeat protein